MSLSAVDCISPAFQHMKQQVFTHFRFTQWMRLALVGILAGELHTGGCSVPNFGQFASNTGRRGNEFLAPLPFPHIDPTKIAQFAGVIAAVILSMMVLFFVFLYLNSIFRFILFDSVIRRECSIGGSWQRWHRAGRRYFLWQLVFLISTWIAFAILIGILLGLAAAMGWFRAPDQHKLGMIGGLVLMIGVILVFALAAAIVQVLAKDFLVPIMALEGLDFADGWSRLLAMMKPEPGGYAIYILMKIVLAIAAGIIFSIAAIIPALVVILPCVAIVLAAHAAGLGWNVMTISLAVIFGVIAVLVLIYLIALVSVPAIVFFPAYSLYFLAGRYPNLAALLNPAPPAPIMPPAPEVSPPLPPAPEPAV